MCNFPIRYREFPEFERYDLEFAARKVVKKGYTSSYSEALDSLARAQLFNDYEHISKTYNLDYNKGKFREEAINFDIAPKHHWISTRGFYYSQFILQKEFDLEPSLAKDLKENIDKFYYPCVIRSQGNVNISDQMLIEEGIKRVEFEKKYTGKKATRIMTEFPFGLYCLCIDSKVISSQGDSVVIPILGFDRFYTEYSSYFLNSDQHILDYAKELFENFVGRFNIVFEEYFYPSLKEHFSSFWSYVSSNFSIVELEESYFGKGMLITQPRENNRMIYTPNQLAVLPNFSSLGQAISYYRSQNKITQVELGELIGKSDRMIRYYESNASIPKLKVLKKMANIFDISIDQLLN